METSPDSQLYFERLATPRLTHTYLVVGASAYPGGYFGEVSSSKLLNGVECLGNETSFASCASVSVGPDGCAHSRDAGVRCAHTGIISRYPLGF